MARLLASWRRQHLRSADPMVTVSPASALRRGVREREVMGREGEGAEHLDVEDKAVRATGIEPGHRRGSGHHVHADLFVVDSTPAVNSAESSGEKHVDVFVGHPRRRAALSYLLESRGLEPGLFKKLAPGGFMRSVGGVRVSNEPGGDLNGARVHGRRFAER